MQKAKRLNTLEFDVCNIDPQIIVGRNLYTKYDTDSDAPLRRMFLDRNITTCTKNYEERITDVALSAKLDRNRSQRYRFIPKTGSCLIDGGDECKFQIYIDDPSFLRAEIEQCILSTWRFTS